MIRNERIAMGTEVELRKADEGKIEDKREHKREGAPSKWGLKE